MLIQKLLDEQMKRQVWNREIEEAEIHEYYRQHWEEFNRPEQVRVADIYIAVPADATEEHKVGLRRKAETALSEALGAREKRSGFATLIDKYSDSHERYRKGDTGFFDMEGKPVGIDGKLAEEAFKLERVGSISEQVIETPGGCHIIMLTGKRAAIQRPLDSVRNELIRRIQREAAAKARRGYIQRVKEKAQIQIGTEHMTAILEELKSQAKEALPTSSKIPVTPGSKDAPEPFQGKKRL
jgi:parvulin-like peptidyl-prolyl isomerase